MERKGAHISFSKSDRRDVPGLPRRASIEQTQHLMAMMLSAGLGVNEEITRRKQSPLFTERANIEPLNSQMERIGSMLTQAEAILPRPPIDTLEAS